MKNELLGSVGQVVEARYLMWFRLVWEDCGCDFRREGAGEYELGHVEIGRPLAAILSHLNIFISCELNAILDRYCGKKGQSG